jgi:hypothetical protein
LALFRKTSAAAQIGLFRKNPPYRPMANPSSFGNSRPRPYRQQTNYAGYVSYWPHGAVLGILHGNTVAPMVEYNSRLQPVCLSDAINNSPNAYLFVECGFNWGTSNNNGALHHDSADGLPGPLSSLTSFIQN